jgi:hypothetical protein
VRREIEEGGRLAEDSVRNNTDDGLTQTKPGQVRAASKGRRVKLGNWEKWKAWNKRKKGKRWGKN